MAIDVEYFTAPGKYYIDLALEIIDSELKNSNEKNFYNGKPRCEASSFKNNGYCRMQKK